MRDHNNRRRKRDYFSNVHNLANAMVKGDVEGTKLYWIVTGKHQDNYN